MSWTVGGIVGLSVGVCCGVVLLTVLCLVALDRGPCCRAGDYGGQRVCMQLCALQLCGLLCAIGAGLAVGLSLGLGGDCTDCG